MRSLALPTVSVHIRSLFLATGVAIAASPAAAQTLSSVAASAGYAVGQGTEETVNGWYAGLGKSFGRVSLVAEASGLYKAETYTAAEAVHVVTGGVRFSPLSGPLSRRRRPEMFLQLNLGLGHHRSFSAHSQGHSSTGTFVIEPAVGVDFRSGAQWGFRVAVSPRIESYPRYGEADGTMILRAGLVRRFGS